MKIVCPEHYCLLEDQDKYVLENNKLPVEAIAHPCPYCNAELRILNILCLNISYLSSEANTSDINVA
ncbi:MAG TPA: hypothetical protein VGE58_01210 [Daejeonella sp.]